MIDAQYENDDVLSEGAMQVDEAVRWSGLGRTVLYAAMAAGHVPYIKHGKRRLIPKAGLRAYLARHMAGDGVAA